MINIRLILTKLYRFLFAKKNTSTQINSDMDPKYLYNITIGLTEDNMIDLIIDHHILNKDKAPSMADAESFAELLIYIGTPSFTNKLISILDNRAETTLNATEKLLIDNILVYYDILQKELTSIKNTNGPIIRPSNVFNAR